MKALVILVCIAMLASQPASAQQTSPAEGFRAFLASRGALLPADRYQLAPAFQGYLESWLSPLPRCGIRRAVDNPPVASASKINVFSVNFPHPADQFCRGSPYPGYCQLLAENCITVETSVFCDAAYIERRLLLADASLLLAWTGVREGIRDGSGRIFFKPLTTNLLLDFARQGADSRAGRGVQARRYNELLDVYTVPEIASSNLRDVLRHIAGNLVLAHEFAHIEQNACPPEMLPTSVRMSDWSKLHAELTCPESTAAVDTELQADLRAIELLSKAIQQDLFELQERGSGFPPSVLAPEFERLMPAMHQLALQTLVHAMEYDLLAHPDPVGGLQTLNAMPPPSQGRAAFNNHMAQAGETAGRYTAPGHIDPAIRALFLYEALDIARIRKINPDASLSLVDIRLLPYLLGRVSAIEKRNCNRPNAGFDTRYKAYLATLFGMARPPAMAKSWMREYASPGTARFIGAANGASGGYAFGGSTNAQAHLTTRGVRRGNWDFMLLVTDQAGEETLRRTYGGAGSDQATAIVSMLGGYALAGTSWSTLTRSQGEVMGMPVTAPAGSSARLIMASTEGAELWSASYQGELELTAPRGLFQNSSGNLVMYGETTSYNSQPARSWAVVFNRNGTQLVDQSFFDEEDVYFQSMIQGTGGNYFVGGKVGNNLWLGSLDSKLDITWQQDLSNQTKHGVRGRGLLLHPAPDGGLMVLGTVFQNRQERLLLSKRAANGDVLWERVYSRGDSNEPVDMITSGENRFMLLGIAVDDSNNRKVPWLLEIDGNGQQVWSRVVNEFNSVKELLATRDGGFIISGSTDNAVADNPWALKLDSKGQIYSPSGDFAAGLREMREANTGQ